MNREDIEKSGVTEDYRSWAIACIDNDLKITELNALYHGGQLASNLCQ